MEIVPNSGVVVLPISTNPARRNRSTIRSSLGSGCSAVAREPNVVGQPCTRLRSLIGRGTPWNGGSSSVGVMPSAAVATAASARARSSSRRAKAFSVGSSASALAR